MEATNMNKIISRSKELLALLIAATAICDASYAIEHDSKAELPPLYIEFPDDTTHHVAKKLALIARTSATLRPNIKEYVDIIIENLGIIEREYDRLSELKSEDEVYRNVVDSLDNMFTNIFGNYDSSNFDVNTSEAWMDVYYEHFANFVVYLFEYLFSEDGLGGENCDSNFALARHDVIELLKIAIAASSSEETK
jgi:hypothetical protein